MHGGSLNPFPITAFLLIFLLSTASRIKTRLQKSHKQRDTCQRKNHLNVILKTINDKKFDIIKNNI